MRRAIILAIAAFLAIGTAFAQEAPQQPRAPQQTQPDQEVKYTNDSIARVSFVDGKTFIQRASDLGNEEAVLNMPVGEGDRLTTADGRAEIHFGKANYLRLDNDSKVDILNLPKKTDDIARIRVWSGSVYLVVGTLAKEKSIEIHTADSSFYVLDKGVYRIDVRENQDTQIFVHSGLIEAAGEGGSSLVKDGQSLEITEGRFASKPATFVADTNDPFDKFSQSRDASLGRTFAKKYLPEELGDYESELDDNGRWVYQAPYGNVWVPNGVDEEWRPYWDGRWVWLGMSGWTWLPYEPWGWATFHYGRWHWGMGLGWYWIPTTLWGPGWVDWWWDDYYFGWAPLSYWGYPGVLWGGAYYGGFYGGNYPVGSRAMTVIRRDQLKAPNASRVALRGDALKGISRVSLTNRTLNLRPAGTKISVQPLSGNRVILRNSQGSGSLVPGRNIDRSSLARPSGSTTSAPSVKRAGGSEGTQTKGTQTKSKPSSVTKSGNSGSSGKSGSARSSGSSKSSGSSGRTIRKHDPEASMSSSQSYFPSQGAAGQVSSPRSVQTYPSSPSVSRPRSYGDGGAARTGSYTNRFTGRPSGSIYSRPSTSSRSGSYSSGRPSSGSVKSGSSRTSSSSGRASSGRSSSGGRVSSGGHVSSGSHSSGGHRR